MRISDWSSDVCSSDLVHRDRRGQMLSGDIVEAIAAAIHEPAFATTDSNTMCNHLERSGFMRVGTDWQGSTGTLSLRVIDPGASCSGAGRTCRRTTDQPLPIADLTPSARHTVRISALKPKDPANSTPTL